MVTSRQPSDERGDAAGDRVHGHDARSVVRRARCAKGLIRIRGKQAPAVEAILEGDVDGGAVGLQAGQRRAGFGEWTTDESPVLVENQDVGRERVGRRGHAADDGTRLVVTATRQPVPGLQHVDFEVVLVATERDRGGEVQILGEDGHRVPGRHHDVLALVRIVERPPLPCPAGGGSRTLRAL